MLNNEVSGEGGNSLQALSDLRASPELMAQLRHPAAITAFRLARKMGWLSVDHPSLDALFAAEPNHPLKAELLSDAQTGGALGMLQYVVLSVFFGLAFLVTIMLPTKEMPPMLFVLWGAIAVCAGLLAKKYPQLIIKKSAKA